MNENDIAKEIVQLCYEIHVELGPGLYESVYEEILVQLLIERGFNVKRQVLVPIRFRDMTFKKAFRADIIVNDLVIIEIKSKESNIPLFKKQTYTYLRMLNLRLGLVVNFNVPIIKEGIFRVVNKLR